MVTPAQSRAARALLGWTQQNLADKAGVAVLTEVIGSSLFNALRRQTYAQDAFDPQRLFGAVANLTCPSLLPPPASPRARYFAGRTRLIARAYGLASGSAGRLADDGATRALEGWAQSPRECSLPRGAFLPVDGAFTQLNTKE
jgi:hypothetical protein